MLAAPGVRAGVDRPRAAGAGASHRDLLHLGAGHPAAGRLHGAGDRGAGRASGRRHRRAAERDVRQRRGADHRRAGAARRPDRSGQGLADRLDHRQRAAGVRRGGTGRRTAASGAAVQSHGGRARHDDAAAQHDWAGHSRRLPPPVARRAERAGARARHRDRARAVRHLLREPGVHAQNASRSLRTVRPRVEGCTTSKSRKRSQAPRVAERVARGADAVVPPRLAWP